MQSFAESVARGTAEPRHKADSAGPARRVGDMLQSYSGYGERLRRMRRTAGRWTRRLVDIARVYANRYPPLAAYMFVLAALCAGPTAVFAAYVAVCTAGIVAGALGAALVAEAASLAAGGAVLALVVSGIALATTGAFAGAMSVYGAWAVAFSAASRVYDRLAPAMDTHDS